jgi:hypothetical protein
MGSSAVPSFLRRAALLGALAGLLLLAYAGAASAAASEAPCWKHVTLDWADNGVVDKTYPLPCYQQAIDNATTDLNNYSSFVEDIRRARARAIAGKNPPDQTDTGPHRDTSSSGDDGVPVPLIVLGGVAILLVGVGAVGLIRRRGRSEGPTPS